MTDPKATAMVLTEEIRDPVIAAAVIALMQERDALKADLTTSRQETEQARAEGAVLLEGIKQIATGHTHAMSERNGPPTITSMALESLQTIFIQDLNVLASKLLAPVAQALLDRLRVLEDAIKPFAEAYNATSVLHSMADTTVLQLQLLTIGELRRAAVAGEK